MSTFITSDLHLFHSNILKYQPNRNASSIEEMHRNLIEEWNSKVSEEDTIYHLGDFSFKKPKSILSQLKGKKIFIMGNHDKREWFARSGKFYDDIHIESRTWNVCEEPFGMVHDYLEIQHNGHLIVLFHFPITHWHKQEYGSLHFHGHTHGAFVNHGRSIDVGWDAHSRILSLDEAVDMVKDREVIKRKYGKL